MGPGSLLSEPALADLVALAMRSPVGGVLVEVGVYRGGSAWRLYEVALEQDRDLHLFDTFAGLPCAGPNDGEPLGAHSYDDIATLRELMPKAHFHPGRFPDTLPADLRHIAFAHIDCDQEESVGWSIEALRPRMTHRGIMLFDDYHCLSGATKAIDRAFPNGLARTGQGKGVATILRRAP